MSEKMDIQELVADSGALISVSGLAGVNDRPVAIDFEFQRGMLRIRCDDDTDQIIVEADDVPPEHPPLDDELLTGLIGSTATYAWSMTNHRGYEDAFQIRFMDNRRHDETRQFEVAASAIDVSRVDAGCR